MKRILLVCTFTVLIISSLKSQTAFKFNHYDIVYKGKLMPVMTLFTNYDFGNRWAFTNYFYVNGTEGSSWGEGLVGPTYSVTKWLNVSLLGGIQSNEDKLYRGGPIITANKGRFSFFCAMEFGGKRDRWDVMAFYVLPKVKFGGELVRSYKMMATGPRCEFSFIKAQPVTIFYSALWDFVYGNFASMFGIYTGFPKKK